jgi:hypothetical protein
MLLNYSRNKILSFNVIFHSLQIKFDPLEMLQGVHGTVGPFCELPNVITSLTLPRIIAVHMDLSDKEEELPSTPQQRKMAASWASLGTEGHVLNRLGSTCIDTDLRFFGKTLYVYIFFLKHATKCVSFVIEVLLCTKLSV